MTHFRFVRRRIAALVGGAAMVALLVVPAAAHHQPWGGASADQAEAPTLDLVESNAGEVMPHDPNLHVCEDDQSGAHDEGAVENKVEDPVHDQVENDQSGPDDEGAVDDDVIQRFGSGEHGDGPYEWSNV